METAEVNFEMQARLLVILDLISKIEELMPDDKILATCINKVYEAFADFSRQMQERGNP